MKLTIALERYDRHFPFFDGTAKPPAGVDFEVLQVGQSVTLRDGTDRHGRMLRGEFDVCEFSLSTYLMAKARGMPITAVPVFPRRLFSALSNHAVARQARGSRRAPGKRPYRCVFPAPSSGLRDVGGNAGAAASSAQTRGRSALKRTIVNTVRYWVCEQ